MIPVEAVEAAARWLQSDGEQEWLAWDDIEPFGQEQYRTRARIILEAAAPYMHQSAKAEAWDEGESAGASNHAAEEYPWLPIISNPYRTNNEKG